jgi:DNA-binding NarL/FixJ family response regulator
MDVLGTIAVPTLIVSPRRPHYQDIAAKMAASIKGAQLFTIEADETISGRWLPEATAAIEEFLGIARDEAAGEVEPAPAGEGAARLTSREREILALLVAGKSNREIAEELVLGERTVARHIANMYEKAGVHGRAEITAYALRHRIV